MGDETREEKEGERKGWLTVGEEGPACDVDDEDVDDELSDLHGGEVLLPLWEVRVASKSRSGRVELGGSEGESRGNEPRASFLRRWRSSSSLWTSERRGQREALPGKQKGPTHDDVHEEVDGNDDPLLLGERKEG